MHFRGCEIVKTWVKDNGVPSGVICPGTEAIYIVRSLTAWSLVVVEEEEEPGRDDPLICVGSLWFFKQLARSKPIL